MFKLITEIDSRGIRRTSIYLMIAFLWTSYTSDRLIQAWGWDIEKVNPTPMWIAQIISIPMLAAIIFCVTQATKLAKNQPKIVILFFFYLHIFLIIFLSVAPGCFTEDTYYTLHMVKNGWWDGWYSPLHPALITALIQIIPWGVNAPGLFLVFLWAMVYVGAHFLLTKLGAPRALHFALLPLAFIPAQLASTIIIIRDSYFSGLFLLFLEGVFYLVVFRAKLNINKICCLYLMGAILVFYRSDTAPGVLIALLSVAFIYTKAQKVSKKYPTFIAMIAPFALVYLFVRLPSLTMDRGWIKGNTWSQRAEQEYKLTLIENPLGYIVRNNGFMTESQRGKIERVFKIKDLEKYWCPGNLCIFYGEHWNKLSTKEDRDAAFNASLAIFLQNPRLFALSRYETLSAVGEKNTQTTCSSSLRSSRGYPRTLSVEGLNLTGKGILSIIRDTETHQGEFGGKEIWWNVYAPFFLLIILILFFKAAPASSLIALILLTRTIVVALAAPAGFSIYYMTLFIGTPFIFILWIGERNLYKIQLKLDMHT